MISIKRSSGEISTVAYIYRFVDYCLLARVRDWLPRMSWAVRTLRDSRKGRKKNRSFRPIGIFLGWVQVDWDLAIGWGRITSVGHARFDFETVSR